MEHLRLFASYGQMMIDQNAESACIPFQRLVFAIRDWELDDDLGLEAGTKFLQSVMEEMEDTEEGVELLNSLRTSFRRVFKFELYFLQAVISEFICKPSQQNKLSPFPSPRIRCGSIRRFPRPGRTT